MELKKCPEVEYCIDGKFRPRCMNYNYKNDTCSGMWHFKCAPYTELELKKLDIYWRCMTLAQKEKEKKENGTNP